MELDRCSQKWCPAVPLVEVTFPGKGSLVFCGHHYNQRRTVLLQTGFEVTLDNREFGQIFENPTLGVVDAPSQSCPEDSGPDSSGEEDPGTDGRESVLS